MVTFVAHNSGIKIPELIHLAVSIQVCGFYFDVVRSFHCADHAGYAEAALVINLASAFF